VRQLLRGRHRKQLAEAYTLISLGSESEASAKSVGLNPELSAVLQREVGAVRECEQRLSAAVGAIRGLDNPSGRELLRRCNDASRLCEKLRLRLAKGDEIADLELSSLVQLALNLDKASRAAATTARRCAESSSLYDQAGELATEALRRIRESGVAQYVDCSWLEQSLEAVRAKSSLVDGVPPSQTEVAEIRLLLAQLQQLDVERLVAQGRSGRRRVVGRYLPAVRALGAATRRIAPADLQPSTWSAWQSPMLEDLCTLVQFCAIEDDSAISGPDALSRLVEALEMAASILELPMPPEQLASESCPRRRMESPKVPKEATHLVLEEAFAGSLRVAVKAYEAANPGEVPSALTALSRGACALDLEALQSHREMQSEDLLLMHLPQARERMQSALTKLDTLDEEARRISWQDLNNALGYYEQSVSSTVGPRTGDYFLLLRAEVDTLIASGQAELSYRSSPKALADRLVARAPELEALLNELSPATQSYLESPHLDLGKRGRALRSRIRFLGRQAEKLASAGGSAEELASLESKFTWTAGALQEFICEVDDLLWTSTAVEKAGRRSTVIAAHETGIVTPDRAIAAIQRLYEAKKYDKGWVLLGDKLFLSGSVDAFGNCDNGRWATERRVLDAWAEFDSDGRIGILLGSWGVVTPSMLWHETGSRAAALELMKRFQRENATSMTLVGGVLARRTLESSAAEPPKRLSPRVGDTVRHVHLGLCTVVKVTGDDRMSLLSDDGIVRHFQISATPFEVVETA
jgi:hypothetical protein